MLEKLIEHKKKIMGIIAAISISGGAIGSVIHIGQDVIRDISAIKNITHSIPIADNQDLLKEIQKLRIELARQGIKIVKACN